MLSDVNIPEKIVRNENCLKTIRDYKIGALHQPELEEANSVATPPLLGVRPNARKRRAQLQSLSKVVGTPTVSRYVCLSTIIPSKNLTSPSPAPPFNVGFDV